MDIQCPTCGEPWDSYHLLYDEIWETNLSRNAQEAFAEGNGQLDKITKPALEALGWRFASSSVLSFTRCPICREGKELPHAKALIAQRKVLAELLGDDLDGFTSLAHDHFC